MILLGIDVGGSGIKGAPVDLDRGVLAAERHRIPTPQPSTPREVVEVIAEVAHHFDWAGPLGCTFPGIVKQGVVGSAANVHSSWVGVNGQQLIAQASGTPVERRTEQVRSEPRGELIAERPVEHLGHEVHARPTLLRVIGQEG